jgi:hypothetical protein
MIQKYYVHRIILEMYNNRFEDDDAIVKREKIY